MDIWHANAHGLYSNLGEDIVQRATPGETFMLGHQITGDEGNVEFEAIVHSAGKQIRTPDPRIANNTLKS